MIDALFAALDTLAKESVTRPAVAFPVYALAGLAGSTFPCVYPLVPVTAGFIKTRTQAHESRYKHPLLYWIGMMCAYAILGFFAAAFGGAFNTIMQSGPAVTLTGFLFLFLTAVMLDWHPITWQTGDRLLTKAGSQSGPLFTVAMGLLAGIIASACTAPAIVTMLLFIAQHSSGSIGWTAYGTALSAVFGLGLGMPFFLVGVLGAHLPRHGRWMTFVKVGFAALVFMAALFQLEKGFRTMGFSTTDIWQTAAGILLLAFAVFLWARSGDGSLPARVKQFFGLVAVSFGIALIVRAVALHGPAAPATAVVRPAAESEMVGNLKFLRDRDAAFSLAKTEGRPIFIDFYADWCANCKDFSRLAQSDAELNKALSAAVLLKIYDTDKVFEEFQNDSRFQELTIGLPFFLVYKPDGSYTWKSYNYRDTKSMIAALEKARK
ncbi:MAG: thioredoxin family protein [Spirochaetia bacterium]|nr:thioredoxin family protein [Spirochaetia bacterium]